MLLYFSDETGDPGWRGGSSRHFGVCLLRIEPANARMVDAPLRQARRQLGLRPSHEFKWSRNHPEIRLAALDASVGHHFGFRARIWRKLAPPANHNDLRLIEVDLLRQCLDDFGPPFRPAKLTVDGARDRERASRIRKGLQGHLAADGHPCIREIRLQNSESSNLLQLADLLAGWCACAAPLRGSATLVQALSLRGTCLDYP